jgi:aminomethyltransferase
MALVFDRTTQQGRLELTDRDRFKLLHNMTTQDFNTIKVGEGRSAVLTTALARIIDRVIVYHRGESALMITNYAGIVRPWLQRHIFFNDKVRLQDVSATLGQLEFYGENAAEIANTLAPQASSLAVHGSTEFTTEAGRAMIARALPMAGEGFIMVAPIEAIPALKATLLEAGAVEADAARYDQLRIEAGLAGAPHELSEDYIPLEAGLWDSVSFQKGCYIGQEIIARMESRQRLAKTLVKLNVEALPTLGATISMGDRNIGTVTSAVQTAQGSIALAFIKPEFADAGTQLMITTEGQPALTAQVVDAPLLQTGFAEA